VRYVFALGLFIHTEFNLKTTTPPLSGYGHTLLIATGLFQARGLDAGALFFGDHNDAGQRMLGLRDKRSAD
jgi:hypothetical protein